LLTPTESDRLVVVLVRPRNPLNIGAAARAMSNFGFHRLRVVNPYEVAFREARSAVGASKVLEAAEEFENVAAAVADCGLVVGTTAVGERHLQHPLRQLDQNAGALIRGHFQQERVALLFGSEKFGLSNEDFSHCHWLLHIPTRDEHLSMNLGQAVAVCLYELSRESMSEEQAEPVKHAVGEELERVTQILLDVLERSGFVIRGNEVQGEERIRRLVRRMQLTSGDAEMWLGILRQILWRIESKDKRAE
jgi:TrmH family RNA methyltransferase